MSKVNNKDTRTTPKKMKTPERRQCRCSDLFIVNFKHISHLVLVFLLLNFRQVNAGWESKSSNKKTT